MSLFEKLGKLAFVGVIGFTIYVGIAMNTVSSEGLIYQADINGTTVRVYHQDRRFADDTYRIGIIDNMGVERFPMVIGYNKPYPIHFDNGNTVIIDGSDATFVYPDGSKELIDPDKWVTRVEDNLIY